MKTVVHLACVAIVATLGCGRGDGGAGAERNQKAGADAARPAPTTGETPGGSAATSEPMVALTGKIHLIGEPPAPAVLKVDSDAHCAHAHADSPPVSEEVVVDAAGMVANAFVYVRSGLEGKSFTTPTTPAVLDQKGCMYVPHVLGMMPNQPLKVLNSDPTLHNVHSHPNVEGNKEFNLAMPRAGGESVRTFAKPEIMIPVRCDVHPWMVSYIGVVEHPFYAVTDKNGTFTIANLPHGTYTIEAWHEKFGVQTQTITVGDTPTAEIEFSYQSAGS